jgi:3-deoxy-D-manno-oct-2-ulosonic acid (Kdo) hydroxylase
MAVISISLEALAHPSAEQTRAWCAQLEEGNILYFPQTPIALDLADQSFLLNQQQTNSSLHKNIAYKPNKDQLSGIDRSATNAETFARVHTILRNYSAAVTNFLSGFLSPYQQRWQLDYASYRPQEEQGRDLPLRRRNDLLHTDAFPTRPTYGARILRFFNNIHPTRTRDWVVGTPFTELIRHFVPMQIAPPSQDNWTNRMLKQTLTACGVGRLIPELKRSPYDEFMMRFHNFLKEHAEFQSSHPKLQISFPPGSSWMVYTETVPHAVLAGQYALEQTFLVSPDAMVEPKTTPLNVLEGITGSRLI